MDTEDNYVPFGVHGSKEEKPITNQPCEFIIPKKTNLVNSSIEPTKNEQVTFAQANE